MLGLGGTKKAVKFLRDGLEPERPWRRFFGRFLDIVILSVLTGLILGIAAPEFGEKFFANNLLAGLVILAVIVPVEATMTALFGTTLGKWALGMRIENAHGAIPSFGLAMARSFQAYIKGIGLGLPIIYLVTLFFSYKALRNGKRTAWDESTGTRVRYTGIRWWMLAILAVVLSGVFYLSYSEERDTKALNAFIATSEQYPQARKAALETYFNKISASIENELGAGLKNCIYISVQCRNKIGAMRNDLVQLKRDVETSFAASELEVRSLDVSDSVKTDMIERMNESLGKIRADYEAFYAVEEEILNIFDEIATLLSVNMFKVELTDGQLLFEDAAPLERYKHLMKRLTDLAKSEEESMKKL